MSRAFVKEDDNGAPETLPERPVSPHTNYVTPRGLRLLEQQMRELARERDAIRDREDISSKQRLAQLDRDMRYIQSRVETAQLVRQANPGKVHFGCTVEVLDEQDQMRRFTIVGEDEADAANGLISWVSPLARALNDAECGDEVTWERPAGNMLLEIVSIRNDQQ